MQNLREDIELDRLEEALADARAVEDRPSLIIVRTHIAPGSPNKQDTHGAHGSPLGEEEIRLTKEVYGWPSMEPFFVPDEALAHFRQCGRRAARSSSSAEWREAFDAYRADAPGRWRPSSSASSPAGCPTAGTTTCPRRVPSPA